MDAGQAISPAVKVQVQDIAGNTVTDSSAGVSLAIVTGPAGATLTGGSATAASGDIRG